MPWAKMAHRGRQLWKAPRRHAERAHAHQIHKVCEGAQVRVVACGIGTGALLLFDLCHKVVVHDCGHGKHDIFAGGAQRGLRRGAAVLQLRKVLVEVDSGVLRCTGMTSCSHITVHALGVCDLCIQWCKRKEADGGLLRSPALDMNKTISFWDLTLYIQECMGTTLRRTWSWCVTGCCAAPPKRDIVCSKLCQAALICNKRNTVSG